MPLDANTQAADEELVRQAVLQRKQEFYRLEFWRTVDLPMIVESLENHANAELVYLVRTNASGKKNAAIGGLLMQYLDKLETHYVEQNIERGEF